MRKPMPAKPAKAARKAAPAKKNAKAKPANKTPAATPTAIDRDERKYQAQDALRTLTRAAEIQRDPKLMKDARALAQQQMAQLRQVSGGMAGGEGGEKKA